MRLILSLFFITGLLEGCGRAPNSGNPLSILLGQLDPACPEPARVRAAQELRQLGTNAFPLLVAEMNSFRWHTPEERDETIVSRTRRLREAFQVIGTNLAPLIPEFLANLDTNRNFVSALDGLAATGELGVRHIVEAVTNQQSPIRLNAIATVMKLGTNSDTARLAVPNLILLFKDPSAIIRSLSTEAVGLLCDQQSACLSPLLRVARADPDLVVRTQAIKAIWRIHIRLGHTGPDTIAVLEEISKTDESQAVRSCAERFLAGKQP